MANVFKIKKNSKNREMKSKYSKQITEQIFN